MIADDGVQIASKCVCVNEVLLWVLMYGFVFVLCCVVCVFFCFFFNDTATTEIYTLSLHDALPISSAD